MAIYYRDAWAAKKLGPVSCTTLAAMTLAEVGPLLFAVPGLTLFVGANVPPLVGGTWDGPFINACGGS